MAVGLTVGTGGGNKDVTLAYIGTPSGNKLVTEVYVGTPGGNKLVFSSLSVTASPSSIFDTVSGSQQGTTQATTATPSGGVGPFSFSWRFVSGGAGLTISSPTQSSTVVRGTPGANETLSGTMVCDVTDTSTGLVATSNAVGATIVNIS